MSVMCASGSMRKRQAVMFLTTRKIKIIFFRKNKPLRWLMKQVPAYLPGAFLLAVSALRAVPKLTERFRTGEGFGWHEHDAGLFRGTEMFFRPGYAANLISSWIPALDGVEEKLKAGAKVADIGCGLGASTVLMAQAYPNSTFAGFDYHDKSIEMARERAAEGGVADRVSFEVAKAKDFPGDDYDFVTYFDCLHDMGDPVGAAAHVKESLASDGTWMIVEPFAHDDVKDNLNPIGRAFYSASTLLCTPASMSQEVGLGIGRTSGRSANARCHQRKAVFHIFAEQRKRLLIWFTKLNHSIFSKDWLLDIKNELLLPNFNG